MPLWLQMAYNGGIWFIDIPFSRVNWINDLRFNKKHSYIFYIFLNKIFNKKGKYVLITSIGGFQNYSLEQKGICYTILDLSEKERGWIQYNIIGGEDLYAKRYVVIRRKSYKDQQGLKKKEYYILVIRLTSKDDEYKRAGVGLIQSDYIFWQKLNV